MEPIPPSEFPTDDRLPVNFGDFTSWADQSGLTPRAGASSFGYWGAGWTAAGLAAEPDAPAMPPADPTKGLFTPEDLRNIAEQAVGDMFSGMIGGGIGGAGAGGTAGAVVSIPTLGTAAPITVTAVTGTVAGLVVGASVGEVIGFTSGLIDGIGDELAEELFRK